MSCFGASETLFYKDRSWLNYYWTIPMLAGYRIHAFKKITFTIFGGIQVAIRQGNGAYANDLIYWGDVQPTIGLEADVHRLKFGITGHYGLIPFQKFDAHQYYHTIAAAYIGYTLWDQAKARARRLERQQAKRLTH